MRTELIPLCASVAAPVTVIDGVLRYVPLDGLEITTDGGIVSKNILLVAVPIFPAISVADMISVLSPSRRFSIALKALLVTVTGVPFIVKLVKGLASVTVPEITS